MTIATTTTASLGKPTHRIAIADAATVSKTPAPAEASEANAAAARTAESTGSSGWRGSSGFPRSRLSRVASASVSAVRIRWRNSAVAALV